jgi:transcriptional regulator of acetoin/glycerol metabolism
VFEFLVHRYAWPGNVRELKHALEHAVLFCDRIITWRDLPEKLRKDVEGVPNSANLTSTMSLERHFAARRSTGPLHLESIAGSSVRDARSSNFVENPRDQLLRLLEDVDGNISEAARRLGVARTTLYRRFMKYGIRKQLKME